MQAVDTTPSGSLRRAREIRRLAWKMTEKKKKEEDGEESDKSMMGNDVETSPLPAPTSHEILMKTEGGK